jgi:transposase InsO family protein
VSFAFHIRVGGAHAPPKTIIPHGSVFGEQATGCPWENPYSETFNSKLRDELLNVEEFGSVAEAKFLAKEYQNKYNTLRPHSALGGKTPNQFARHGLA